MGETPWPSTARPATSTTSRTPRGGHRPDRHRDQEHPGGQGQPPGGLCPHRARRGLAHRRDHRPLRRGQPLQPRAAPGPQAAAAPARRSTSCSAARKSKGLTLIPLRLYIDARGRAKLELGLARGKQLHDRRRDDRGARCQARPRPGAVGRPKGPLAVERSLTRPPTGRGSIWHRAGARCAVVEWSEPRTRSGTHGDAWFRQGRIPGEREPRCRQASLNRRQNEVTGNRQPALALAA